MRLLLIRHPRPDVPEGTCYGRSDVAPETAHFEEVVRRLRDRWRTGVYPRPWAVYSSPLARCSRVAAALAGDPWPEPVLDARLAEMDFGRWEGLLWNDIERGELDAWRADFVQRPPPGGESVAQMASRARQFADERLAPERVPAGALVVLVTHAGIIQTLPRVLAGEPLSGFRMTRLDFGTITAISRRGAGYEVESRNEAP